jgi:hypothetical protein
MIVVLNIEKWDIGTRIFQGIVATVYWCLGIACIKRARKHKYLNGHELARKDDRPCVLYLRRFYDDRVASKVVGTPFLGLDAFKVGSLTEEEQLSLVVSAIGPFVAIGRPGEKLPELGALRCYVDDNQWEEKVLESMRSASLVVLRAGAIENTSCEQNILREAKMARDNVLPERLVLTVPSKATQYEAFRLASEGTFARGLPANSNKMSRASVGSLQGIVYFDSDWTSHFVEIAAPQGFIQNLLSTGRAMVPGLTTAFRPVFRRHAIEPPRTPVNWALVTLRVTWMGVALACVAFVLWVALKRLL